MKIVVCSMVFVLSAVFMIPSVNVYADGTHTHDWSAEWSMDENYHWHICNNSDGLCDVSDVSGMDSYAEHVFDDDSDADCNTCGYIRTSVSPAPEISDVTESGVTDDSGTLDTYYQIGGYDEDGNWVGFVDGLDTIIKKLDVICWHLECIVAFCLILVVFGTWKIVRSWSKGMNIK